ncbi:hypothetical protein GF385_00570 [Candidatus Dependentiae bacterium]|nr:hypothetical protein [Candidatus Dependentiae bacterium]
MRFLNKFCNNKFHKIFFNLFVIIFIFNFLNASHNTSRYFPFLERPAEYVNKRKSHVSPSLFYIKADTAFSRGGGNAGIPELYGKYDLRDVIASLEKVKGAGFTNPIEEERGPGDAWLNKSIRFRVNGKIKSRGFLFNYEQCFRASGNFLHWKGLSLGTSFPLMHVNTSDNFYFLEKDSDNALKNLRSGELDQLNRIRRKTNEELDVQGGDWTKSGVGDVDLHAGLNFNWGHKWLMRSIDLNFRLGTTIPTGVNSYIDYPSSVSFMGNGHWTLYFDVLPEFELKQDWKIGLLLGAMYQFNNTRTLRIPVYQEPAIFSALIANVKIDPGYTIKFSPYFIAENLTDGIDFQLRYTYLRHSNDKWIDTRSDPAIKSYLNQEVGTTMWEGKDLTEEDISNNIAAKENLTRWRMHYISLELVYDSKEAGNNWILDPKIFLTFDYQFSGNGSCKTHQLTLGVQAHF